MGKRKIGDGLSSKREATRLRVRKCRNKKKRIQFKNRLLQVSLPGTLGDVTRYISNRVIIYTGLRCNMCSMLKKICVEDLANIEPEEKLEIPYVPLLDDEDKKELDERSNTGISIQFVFYTCNNPQKWGPEEEVRTKWILEWAKKTTFHCFCLEMGEQGTPHYQGIAMWKNITTTGVISAWLERNGWSCDFRRSKNVQAAIEYCQHTGAHADKPGLMQGPFNTGTRPSNDLLKAMTAPLKSTDKDWLLACLDASYSDKDLMLEFPKQWLKYSNTGIAGIRQNARDKEVGYPFPFPLPNGSVVEDPQPVEGEDEPAKQRHVYIYGPANSRKSAWLKQTFTGKCIFFIRKGKYPFEGYDNERILIADMVSGLKWSWLEELCEYDEHDRTVPGDTRYTAVWMHRKTARMVIILSNDAPHYPGREEPFNERFWTWKLGGPIDLPPRSYRPRPDWGNSEELVAIAIPRVYVPYQPSDKPADNNPSALNM